MAIGEKILGFLTGSGGMVEKGLELIDKRIPDKDLAAQLKHDFEVLALNQSHQVEMTVIESDRETERLFNERTIAMEGTAGDLKSVPIIGAFVLFLRGAYRPLFAYFVAYLDFVYFVTGMAWTETQESLLFAINMLVIGFFFGERAAKNVLPLLAQAFTPKEKA